MSIILTSTNKYLDLANPKPEDIDLEDLIKTGSEENRFASKTQYKRNSICEHSVLVSYLVKNDKARLLALFHDIGEMSGLKDLPSPLKKLLPDYAKIEDRMLDVILNKFKIKQSKKLWKIVKEADNKAYSLERLIFFKNVDKKERKEAFKTVRSLGIEPGLSPARARKLFIDRYLELTQSLEKVIKI